MCCLFLVPDQVATLSFDNILDTSLRVLWTPPNNINGILKGNYYPVCGMLKFTQENCYYCYQLIFIKI